MKKTLLFLIVVFTAVVANSQDVTLTTQAQVDAYVGGATVTGSLTIGPSSGGTAITDLSVLSTITSVTKYLYIYENTSLTNLSGLENLSSVVYFYLGDNPELLNMDALSTSLTSVGDYVEIYRNPKLSSLSGLSNISSIDYGFYFEGNNAVLNFSELTSLTSLGGGIWILDNTGLTSLSGFESISTTNSYLIIENNNALLNLTGFDNLTSIGSALDIKNNLLLSSFSGLAKLETVVSYFNIEGNSTITNLDGFDALNSIGEFLLVKNNSELTSLNGIETLTNLNGAGTVDTGRIQIDANVKLTDISGMENIDSGDITYLTLRNNSLLSTCEISNVCSYLGIPGTSIISGNANGCANATEINTACAGATASVSDYLLGNVLSVYPNPVDDLVYIKKLTNIDIQNIQLYDLQGTLVKESTMVDDQLDLSTISSGMYFLKITTNDGVATQKLIKQ